MSIAPAVWNISFFMNCALTLPVYSAVKLSIEAYDAEDCPICKEGKRIDALVNSFGFSKL